MSILRVLLIVKWFFDLIVNSAASRGTHKLTVTTPLGEAAFEMLLSPKPPESLSSSSSTGAGGVYSLITDATVIPSSEPLTGAGKLAHNNLQNAAGCDDHDVATGLPSITGSAITVVKGSGIKHVSPSLLSVESGAIDLVVYGVGLDNVDSLSIIPNDNLIIGDVNVNAEGNSVTSTVTVEPGVALGKRRVALSSAGKLIAPLSATADSIYVGGKPPAIDSIEPATVGPGVTKLTLRGSHFQQARSVFVLPAGDITLANRSSVNDEGTELTVDIAVASSANLGSRVIAVATPTGVSSTAASPAYTLTIADAADVQPAVADEPTVENEEVQSATQSEEPQFATKSADTQPTTATIDGPDKIEKPNEADEIKEELSPKEQDEKEQDERYYASHIGVIKGAAVYSLYPTVHSIGSNFTMTLKGVGLRGIDKIKFVPSTGITLSAVRTSAEGDDLMVDVAIAEDAPVITRQVQLIQNGRVIPVVTPGSDRFRIIAPQLFIESVVPKFVLTNNTPQLLTVRGRLLNDPQQLRIEPSDGIRVDKLQFNKVDNTVTAEVTVSDNAATGTRTVVIDTQKGSTRMDPNPDNSITIAGKIDHVKPILSPPLSIIKKSASAPLMLKRNVQSPLLGVSVQKYVKRGLNLDNSKIGEGIHSLGVTLGSVATRVTPSEVSADTSVILIINGSQLANVTDIQLQPNTGITVGSVLAGTRQVSVPLTIAADAPSTKRRIIIKADNDIVEFSNLAEGLLQIVEPATANNIIN